MNVITSEYQSKVIGRPASDLSGKIYGRWKVIKLDSRDRSRRALWECQCECGNKGVVRHDVLKLGNSNSCGCLQKEMTIERATKHGRCKDGKYNGDSTYVTWKSMKQRCNDNNSEHYPYYGALGISVCERWIESFQNFVDDMGDRPKGTTIDRINPFGNYEPTNCRWANSFVQNNNMRKHYTGWRS